MKTTYILHGGSAQHVNSENDPFFKEILKKTSNNPRILLVHFASPPERLESNKERDTSQFLRNKGNKKLIFIEAVEVKFIEQIAQSDVIYLGGGTTGQLISALSTYRDFADSCKGKIVAGESAGANVQASYCYSKSGGGIIKGLGMVPVFMYPHYEKGGEKEIDLTQIPDSLERLFLANYEFRVFEI
ncbi:Type 1 glutamine amidotransferase-like domain-containing protein [Candidatus Woesebacteria bacterium]|nr:Type 1 glutamine amidotransferase-like domain-containing protein [Candidatus Woesebacteria bacterium]